MGDPRWAMVLLLQLTLIIGLAFAGKAIIRCDCTTQECIAAGKTMCVAKKACYAELLENKLTRGCDPNSLACDSRPPRGRDLDLGLEWPTLHCCKDRDLCNKHIIPKVPENKKGKIPAIHPLVEEHIPVVSVNDDKEHSPSPDCPPNTASSSSSSSSDPSHVVQPKTKIINPIYIAVPVAGVCVLLALIIFAMYLLRRRTVYHHGHHHDNFHHYHHEHIPELSQKQTVSHHCQCTCKKQTLPACSKGNRCTESERSSSGSETKLFLQT